MTIVRLCHGIATAGVTGTWVTPDKVDRSSREAGAYLLLIRLDEPIQADLPRLGSPRFEAGWFVYAGSARGPGGLAARIGRHFRRDKGLRWHVDRLTVGCGTMAALQVAGGTECDLVRRLVSSGRLEIAIRGFGSSDCRTCEGHLLMPAVSGGDRRQPSGEY